jgi:hypothetical protein
MTMNTSKRFLGEGVELSHDCELGHEGDRAVVVALDGPYMSLDFPDRAPDCRDVHTGADYKYLRAYGGSGDPDLTALSMKVRAKLNARGETKAGSMTPAAVALDRAIGSKDPRDITMYAMDTLSNAQELIQRTEHDGQTEWKVTTAFAANTIRQHMNIAKYAIDRAVPREVTPGIAQNLRARVQLMAKKFRDEVAQADDADDKSPFDEANIETAFVLLEQLTAVPR